MKGSTLWVTTDDAAFRKASAAESHRLATPQGLKPRSASTSAALKGGSSTSIRLRRLRPGYETWGIPINELKQGLAGLSRDQRWILFAQCDDFRGMGHGSVKGVRERRGKVAGEQIDVEL